MPRSPTDARTQSSLGKWLLKLREVSLYGQVQSTVTSTRELEVLSPDWVIFLCGRTYAENNLERYFHAPLRGKLSKKNPIVLYTPASVGWKGIVTYHPSFLRRAGLREVLDEIVGRLLVRNRENFENRKSNVENVVRSL
jgi:hypothetical protein